MRQVKFIKPYGFAEDGIRTTAFAAGQTVLVSGSCADSAIQAGAAVEVVEAAPVAPEAKAVSAAPENKAKGRPADKARG